MREGGSGISGLVGDCWNSGKEKQNYCRMESVEFGKRMFLIKGKKCSFSLMRRCENISLSLLVAETCATCRDFITKEVNCQLFCNNYSINGENNLQLNLGKLRQEHKKLNTLISW